MVWLKKLPGRLRYPIRFISLNYSHRGNEQSMGGARIPWLPAMTGPISSQPSWPSSLQERRPGCKLEMGQCCGRPAMAQEGGNGDGSCTVACSTSAVCLELRVQAPNHDGPSLLPEHMQHGLHQGFAAGLPSIVLISMGEGSSGSAGAPQAAAGAATVLGGTRLGGSQAPIRNPAGAFVDHHLQSNFSRRASPQSNRAEGPEGAQHMLQADSASYRPASALTEEVSRKLCGADAESRTGNDPAVCGKLLPLSASTSRPSASKRHQEGLKKKAAGQALCVRILEAVGSGFPMVQGSRSLWSPSSAMDGCSVGPQAPQLLPRKGRSSPSTTASSLSHK